MTVRQFRLILTRSRLNDFSITSYSFLPICSFFTWVLQTIYDPQLWWYVRFRSRGISRLSVSVSQCCLESWRALHLAYSLRSEWNLRLDPLPLSFSLLIDDRSVFHDVILMILEHFLLTLLFDSIVYKPQRFALLLHSWAASAGTILVKCVARLVVSDVSAPDWDGHDWGEVALRRRCRDQMLGRVCGIFVLRQPLLEAGQGEVMVLGRSLDGRQMRGKWAFPTYAAALSEDSFRHDADHALPAWPLVRDWAEQWDQAAWVWIAWWHSGASEEGRCRCAPLHHFFIW